MVSREYGHKAETVGSVLFLVGIFISIVSQVISSSAMIGSLFGMPTQWASIAGAALIMLMVLHGGIRSAGVGGIVKLILLYLCTEADSCHTLTNKCRSIGHGTYKLKALSYSSFKPLYALSCYYRYK